MMARHGGPPLGSAAREATSPPYVGLHRTQERCEADDPWLPGNRCLQPAERYVRCACVHEHVREGWLCTSHLARMESAYCRVCHELGHDCRLEGGPDDAPDDPPRCSSCAHYLADECGCTCCTWTCDERPANV